MPNNRIDDLLNMGAGSEAQMLGVESDPNWAQKTHTNIVGGEWDKYRDVVQDYVNLFAEPPPMDWLLDFMDSYDELKGESEDTAEDMLERAKQLKTLSTEEAQAEYDDELSQYESSFARGEGFSSEGFPPEVMEILDDVAIGMVDPGKKIKGIMSLVKNFFKGRGLRQSEKIATKNIDESRRLVDEAAESRRSVSERTTPEGTIRVERTVNPQTGWRSDVDPSQKPPFKLKGGGHLYQKGYYGKRYK